MTLIDGKKIAQEIKDELREKISHLPDKKPGLAVVLVGDHPASKIYVEAKQKACREVGIESTLIKLSAAISESDLIFEIERLNQNPTIHGILVQFPLPNHINSHAIAETISPEKDVDGFHPINVGKMLLGQDGGLLPCTPKGIHTLLIRSGIEVEGKHVVILGRSNLVGKPLAAILMQSQPGCNATVTIAHSRSQNLPQICRLADILIAAIGRPRFITADMIKPAAAVIDVGINRLPNGQIVGDVDFDEAKKVAHSITPVPGGVGPMTIASLLQNTLTAFLGIFLLLLSSCQTKDPETCTQLTGWAMTMPYQIIIGKKLSSSEEKKVLAAIEETFQKVDAHFNNWNPDSEISRLNNAPAHQKIALSQSLQELLSFCSRVVSLSGGRFDPTTEPLSRLWRTHLKEQKAPPTELLQQATVALGWSHIAIKEGFFEKDNDQTCLDLCAVSKGLCIDWILDRLQKMGYPDLFVEWAGEIRASGQHPSKRDWSIQVDPGLRMENKGISPIPLRNCAIATSGDYRQKKEWTLPSTASFDKEEHHYFHIIDPLSAQPLEKTPYSIAAAVVIAPTCALADALATAAMCFPTRLEAEKWAEEVVELYPEVSFWILSYRS